MQSDHYKESITDALKNLVEVNQGIFDSLIQISMKGELKEWSATVPIGEWNQFDFALFKNSDDTNIQLLVKLIEQVDQTYESLKNINGIEPEEA